MLNKQTKHDKEAKTFELGSELTFSLNNNYNNVRFRHYKGGVYTVLCLSLHTENMEKLVLYRRDMDGTIWSRPYDMFFCKVEDGKKLVDRFTPI